MATSPAGVRLRKGLDAVIGAATGAGVRLLFRLLRRFDRVRLANAGAALMRTVGPWLPEQRTGRSNLAAAYPDKSAAEIETILAGAWDNLGRFAAELAQLDRIHAAAPGEPDTPEVEFTPAAFACFEHVSTTGRPALFFTGHLANWELTASVARSFGLDVAVLFRPPNMRAIADAVFDIRRQTMGTLIASGLDAPVKLARALADGRHVGLLVDQHDGKGVEVEFFGRPCLVSPLLALLARQVDCAIHGVRAIRLPGGRFRIDATPPIAPARDADGTIAVQPTMQAVTAVVEGWVREYPEQWLWLHRRWR